MDDPDAPGGTWVHWIIFNLPPTPNGLPEGLPKTPQLSNGATQGSNSWGKTGYGGPCPPDGEEHSYRIFVYSLDAVLDLQPGATVEELQAALQGHVLAQGKLASKYKRTSDDDSGGDEGGGSGGY